MLVCNNCATRRPPAAPIFAHRAAFVTSDRQVLAQSLSEFASGNTDADTSTGIIGRRAPKLAFLFTGQGAQHVGMGKALYDEACPSFRAWIDRCAKLLEPHIERPLLDVLWTGEANCIKRPIRNLPCSQSNIHWQRFSRNGA